MRFQLVVNGEAHEVETDGAVRVDGRPVAGEATLDRRGVTVRIGRKRYRVLITRWGSVVDDVQYRLEVRSLQEGTSRDSLKAAGSVSAEWIEVRTPMPGRIIRVGVKVGDQVARHAPLAVLEAMKMQNEIPAPVAGRVREVRVKVGQSVLASDILVLLDPE